MAKELSPEDDHLMVRSITHEFLRCEVAFNSFVTIANLKPRLNLNFISDKKTLLYDAYAIFLQHLYEYFICCLKRDKRSLKSIDVKDSDQSIVFEVNKLLAIWLSSIDRGTAPSWTNSRSYYDDKCPNEFGVHFRKVRNHVVHADFEGLHRRGPLTLAEFYRKYHKYVMILYESGRNWWHASEQITAKWTDVDEFYTNVVGK